MPMIVVSMAAADTTNAAAMANGDGQRAASHNSRGKMNASGSNEMHVSVGWEYTKVANEPKTTSTAAPSIMSRREGGSTKARRTSMMRGATTTIPTPSDSNHTSQV